MRFISFNQSIFSNVVDCNKTTVNVEYFKLIQHIKIKLNDLYTRVILYATIYTEHLEGSSPLKVKFDKKRPPCPMRSKFVIGQIDQFTNTQRLRSE